MVLAALETANDMEVQGLVLLGPVLRDAPVVATVFRLLAPLLFNSLWGNGLWLSYYRSLYPVRKPADLESEVALLSAHLQANKHNISNVRQLATASKHKVEAAVEALGKLTPQVPVVAFLGRKDPDYSDADEEAKWLQAAVPHATISVEDDCGHYPHLEDPEKVFAAVAKALGQ
jgi:pimeloyl-ACP methyl ester carboxylesterase